jgi:hypothetical protein
MTAAMLPPQASAEAPVPARPGDYGYSRHAFRLWHGMCLGAWLRLLRGNLGAVSPARYGLLVSVTLCALGNSMLKGLSRLVYGRRLRRVTVAPAPLFVLGHWRSGTTWLTQLLALDPRLAAPTAAQCFMPETFLVAQRLLAPLLRAALPRKRPMDAVALRSDSAEEDEMALLLAGAPTPSRWIAFPLRREAMAALEPGRLTPAQQARWREAWLRFLRAVQYANPGRRLLLKSPLHTRRIAEILHHFPDARFLHIVRDPYAIQLSHRAALMAMAATQGLQARMPGPEAAQELVALGFARMHEDFEAQRGLIPEGNLATLRYEDLRRDPVARLAEVYDRLGLGALGPVQARLQAKLEAERGYRTNTHEMTPAQERAIWDSGRAYFERYGYPRRPVAEGAAP